MIRRRGNAALAVGAAAASAVVSVLLLTGCGAEAAPAESPRADANPSATPTPTSTPDAAVAVPDGSVLAVTATVTADTGAALDLRMVAVAPSAWDDPESQTATAALLANCSGEVDESVLSSGSYRLIRLEVTATARPGPAWPMDLPLVILPAAAEGLILTATDGAVQQEPGDLEPGDLEPGDLEPGDLEPGDYVPHCLQTTALPGTGTGVVIVGFDGGRGWPAALFGFGPQELASSPTPTRLTFSDCRVVQNDEGLAVVGVAALPDPPATGSCAATTTGS